MTQEEYRDTVQACRVSESQSLPEIETGKINEVQQELLQVHQQQK